MLGRYVSLLLLCILYVYIYVYNVVSATQSDTFSYTQPKTPLSPCDSSVFNEGFLSTTLDRKGHTNQLDSSEFRVRLLSATLDCKEHQISSEQKSGQTGMCIILLRIEYT